MYTFKFTCILVSKASDLYRLLCLSVHPSVCPSVSYDSYNFGALGCGWKDL